MDEPTWGSSENTASREKNGTASRVPVGLGEALHRTPDSVTHGDASNVVPPAPNLALGLPLRGHPENWGFGAGVLWGSQNPPCHGDVGTMSFSRTWRKRT